MGHQTHKTRVEGTWNGNSRKKDKSEVKKIFCEVQHGKEKRKKNSGGDVLLKNEK